MKTTPHINPPRWATRLLRWYCRPELAEDLEGDLHEYFQRNLQTRSRWMANLVYIADVLKFMRPYTLRTPKLINLLLQWIMLGSYIKTSGRALVRNKLFSSINIIGLAISMSVGMLMIALLTDLTSFDDFHSNGDRIYRLKTTYKYLDQEEVPLASTSVKAGRLIRETIPGLEHSVILRRGFSGDAGHGTKKLPVSGLYSDSEFFDIFSFSLKKGNPATALDAPYSIILTEKTAEKLFGDTEPLNQVIYFDSLGYTITGIIEDAPKFSHMNFESLVSFSTIEQEMADNDHFNAWTSVWNNYVYMLAAEGTTAADVNANLASLAAKENALEEHTDVTLELQPLKAIVLGPNLSNQIGPTMVISILWIVGGLAFIVILSACFNYTNLSVARALRRSREVGIRKVIGATRRNVLFQFLTEAVLIALLALLFSFILFMLIKPQFLSIASELSEMAALDISLRLIGYFILLAIGVGIIAGLLPAIFFSRINIIEVLKDASRMRIFRNMSFRRILLVVQYTFSLMFISATLIGYAQYKGFLSFDLGFSTENILNVRLQGNSADNVIQEFSVIPEVSMISKSVMITSVGNYYGARMKYKNPMDSSQIYYNGVDENYLPLHGHTFLAGRNLHPRTEGSEESEIIVNEETLREFSIGTPEEAIGEEVEINGNKVTIVGVLKDFHYGKTDYRITPVAFRYMPDDHFSYLNLKIASSDPVAAMAKLEAAWKSIDQVHPFDATFYDDQIEQSYGEFSAMIKMIGFLAFLAIVIASMGLLGMVVYTTETRVREVSIRKVLGASAGNLLFLLSRSFFVMLSIAALIALPATYLLFDNFVLSEFVYHDPISLVELLLAVAIVMGIALLMIGIQTLTVIRRNPAEVLSSE